MSKLMFKGFDKDLKCRDFQYEVGKEYVHNGDVKICGSGFHACDNPMDVFEYYPPSKSRYCEVEGSGKKDTEGNKTSFEKIKIITELGLGGIIQAGIKFCFEKVKWTNKNTSTGYKSGASTTGYYSGASTTGYKSGASATGDCSGASATGYKSGASTTGNRSGASTTGYKSGASTTGYKSGASATGDYSGASATGDCSGASAIGNYSGASAGKGSVAMAVGLQTRGKGEVGSWIVLTECKKTKDGEINVKNVKVAKVDGVKIKADTWYTLEKGKFIEAKDEDYE